MTKLLTLYMMKSTNICVGLWIAICSWCMMMMKDVNRNMLQWMCNKDKRKLSWIQSRFILVDFDFTGMCVIVYKERAVVLRTEHPWKAVHDSIEYWPIGSYSRNFLPLYFLSEKKEHDSKPLNPNFQPFLVCLSRVTKQTLDRSLDNKNTFYTSMIYSVFGHFLYIDYLEFFRVIAHSIEQRPLYKTLYKILSLTSII
jgi:hypothetical protein